MAGNEQQGASTGSLKLTDIVKSYYPDILTTFYTVPPMHFNRVPRSNEAAPDFLKNIPRLPSSVKKTGVILADSAQQHVQTNLQKLGEDRTEVMFIISELSFLSYLKKKHQYGVNKLPIPETLPEEESQGDFDILIIHRKYGILVGEIKSTGSKTSTASNKTVAKIMSKAVQQMDRCAIKARKMFHDVAPDLIVRKALILPYVSRKRLKEILENDDERKKELFESLGVSSTEEAIPLCLLSDQLSDPDDIWNFRPEVLSSLNAWWDCRMACTEDPQLTDELYLEIVARLVGPATSITVHTDCGPRIEMRTISEAVPELARRLVTYVLTHEQVKLMDRNPRLICLTGPPGTGKTLVMKLQGWRWLLEGRDVQVVSTARNTRAISIHIEHQLNMLLEKNQRPEQGLGTVYRHDYNFMNKDQNVDKAVAELLGCVKENELHMLMDEANFTESSPDGKRNLKLVTELAGQVPDLCLWAARIGNRDVPKLKASSKEADFEQVNLTFPLRSAPSVLREVEKAFCQYPDITKYINNGIPAPADGPRVIPLRHHGNGHTVQWPVDCELCGHNVTAELRRLGVGGKVCVDGPCPTPLCYGDVFVLTRSTDLHDDIIDKEEKAIPASGFVRGLRDEGLPVCVLGRPDVGHNSMRWDRDMTDVAKGEMNKVTVAYWADVQGLERPLVVLLPGRRETSDDGNSEERIVAQDRLVAASRAASQLIVVEVHGEPEATPNDVTTSGATKTDVTTSEAIQTDVTAVVATSTDVNFGATPSHVTTSEADPSDHHV